jgi:hypothetical protein
MGTRRGTFLLLIGIGISLSAACFAEELAWLTGRVMSADGKHPLAGAIVAVYDSKNRVIDYAQTDARGEYTLVVPRSVLNLGKKGGGFLHQVTSGFGNAVALPLKAGIRAAAAASTVSDPLTRIGIGAASNIAQALADILAEDEHDRRKKKQPIDRNLPGALVMKVAHPGYNDAVAVARVYWMQQELYTAGGKEQKALAAWVDPVRLTKAGAEERSQIVSEYLYFSDARLEPSIAIPGQTVLLTVRLSKPPEPQTPINVVARNDKNGHMYQLLPIGKDLYRTEIAVEAKYPRNDQIITILAYAQQEDQPGRSKKVEEAILRAGLWNPKKPFVYNPLLVASRNRAEVTLTVVDPPGRHK